VKQYAAAVASQMMAVISADHEARQAAVFQENRIQQAVRAAVAARDTLQAQQQVVCASNNDESEEDEDGDFEISSPWGRGDRSSRQGFECTNLAAMDSDKGLMKGKLLEGKKGMPSDALKGCLQRWQIRSSDAFARWRELYTEDHARVSEVDSTLYDYGGK
jgi:hypothetical protein